MNRKHLRKVVDSFGLQLVRYENGTGNSANIILKAPDGYEGKFIVNRLDDPNSDRINEAQFRRFARDHSHSLPLPEVEEIDMHLSGMQRAMIAAHEKVPTKAVRTVSRLLTNQPLLNPEGVIRNAMAGNPDAHIPGWVSAAPAEDPIPEPVEVIDEALTTPAPKEQPMPSVKLATVRAEKSEATEKRKLPESFNRNKIGQINFFKLCQVLIAQDMTGISTQTKLREVLQAKVDFNLPASTITEALEATGKLLDKPITPKSVDNVDRVLAKELVRLLAKLGEEPSPEVLAIAGA